MSARVDGELVIFDLDDTLLRTAAAVRRARRSVLTTLFPQWTPTQLRTAQAVWRRTTLLYRDQEFADLLRVVANLGGVRLPGGADLPALELAYRREQVERIRADPGVVAVARRLRDEGCALAIASNGDESVQWEKIRRCGLGDLVPAERIVICDGVRLPRKPDPGPLIALRAGARRAVLVGDRTTDVIAGRLAGLPTVRLISRSADLERAYALQPMAAPDAVADSHDLYAAVRKLLGTWP